MFLSRFFKRKSTVVERVEAYTKTDCTPWADRDRIERDRALLASACPLASLVYDYEIKRREYDRPVNEPTITVNVPATVDGALLAQNFERQLKRHGPHS